MSEKGQGTEEVEVGTGTVLAEPGQTGSGGGTMTKPPEEQKYEGRQPTDEEYQEWKKTQAGQQSSGSPSQAGASAGGSTPPPSGDPRTYSSGDQDYLDWRDSQTGPSTESPAAPEESPEQRAERLERDREARERAYGEAMERKAEREAREAGIEPGGGPPPNLDLNKPKESVLEHQDPKDQKPVIS